MINAEDVSLRNKTYISRCSNHSETYELRVVSSGLMPILIRRLMKKDLWYKSLRISKLTAFYMILNLRLIWVGINKSAVSADPSNYCYAPRQGLPWR